MKNVNVYNTSAFLNKNRTLNWALNRKENLKKLYL